MFEHASRVREALRAILADPSLGPGALSSPQLMSSLLKDYLPDAPRETGVLIAATEAGVADALSGYVSQGMDARTAIRLAASSFAASTAFAPAVCDWVASELAIALTLTEVANPTGDVYQETGARQGTDSAGQGTSSLGQNATSTMTAYPGRAGPGWQATPGVQPLSQVDGTPAATARVPITLAVTLRGPGGARAYKVVFSSSGHLLAGVGKYQIWLWNLRTGRRAITLPSTLGSIIRSAVSSAIISSAAFSPDGLLLAGADFKTVRLWDLVTGQPISTLAGHAGAVTSVAFTPDGHLLASASRDKTVRLWDPVTGQPISRLAGHADAVTSVAFSPDGRLLASASRDKTVRLWDPASGRQLRGLTGHAKWVYAVAFSPDGRLLATAGRDKTVRLWDPVTGRQWRSLTGHLKPVLSVAFSPDGRLLASASLENRVRLWDPVTGRELGALTGVPRRVAFVAFSPHGLLLATAHNNSAVLLWR